MRPLRFRYETVTVPTHKHHALESTSTTTTSSSVKIRRPHIESYKQYTKNNYNPSRHQTNTQVNTNVESDYMVPITLRPPVHDTRYLLQEHVNPSPNMYNTYRLINGNTNDNRYNDVTNQLSNELPQYGQKSNFPQYSHPNSLASKPRPSLEHLFPYNAGDTNQITSPRPRAIIITHDDDDDDDNNNIDNIIAKSPDRIPNIPEIVPTHNTNDDVHKNNDNNSASDISNDSRSLWIKLDNYINYLSYTIGAILLTIKVFAIYKYKRYIRDKCCCCFKSKYNEVQQTEKMRTLHKHDINSIEMHPYPMTTTKISELNIPTWNH